MLDALAVLWLQHDVGIAGDAHPLQSAADRSGTQSGINVADHCGPPEKQKARAAYTGYAAKALLRAEMGSSRRLASPLSKLVAAAWPADHRLT